MNRGVGRRNWLGFAKQAHMAKVHGQVLGVPGSQGALRKAGMIHCSAQNLFL